MTALNEKEIDELHEIAGEYNFEISIEEEEEGGIRLRPVNYKGYNSSGRYEWGKGARRALENLSNDKDYDLTVEEYNSVDSVSLQ